MKEKLTLNGVWQMRAADENECIAAYVPGSVYNDLLAAGRMDDPFWRDNELAALALMEKDYVYTKKFTVPATALCASELLLCFDGLDTICDIKVNGAHIASCNNMHRAWEFDVKNIVSEGENSVEVYFHSPVKYMRDKQQECFVDGNADTLEGFSHMRKASCMSGWDWGPKLPDAGIWRDAYLLAVDTARLDSVHILQQHEKNKVTLTILPEIIGDAGCTVTAAATAPDGSVYEMQDGKIVIDSPLLWWPRGYGEQPLYTVNVVISKDGRQLDSWSRRIGLRTITMSREKDKWGEEFCHVVNGLKIFAMGADYIPEDSLFTRVNYERTRALLEDAALANMNIIRVWGGGYYPSDFFYDICDELGLVVWQDFMFACAVYDLRCDFEENIKQEIIQNVKRIRHHASLGIWCGNNEMEMQIKGGIFNISAKQVSDYLYIFEHMFPKLVAAHDPQTFYWPASPSSGGGFDEPNDPNRGDVHYWSVWHGNKPFSDYRNYFFRYASEFGFQSFPCMQTIKSFAEPEDLNVYSYVMEKHQRSNSANSKMMSYMGATFLYPTSFDTMVYASQLMQAEAIKYGVEHWRRNRGRCMGAIYWQLNDCWPVASWSSVDFFGRWKALHYFAKRFFAPVMLSACEEGIITQDPNINARPYTLKKSARLSVANETWHTVNGTVGWQLRDTFGRVIREGKNKVSVPAFESLWLDEMDFADCDLFENYLSYDLTDDEGNIISAGTVMFCPPKYFHFKDPKLSFSVDGDYLTVRSKTYARGVEILNENEDMVLEDNYFDLNPGERRVKIIRGDTKGIKLRSVYDIR